jgi:hypothetical protein
VLARRAADGLTTSRWRRVGIAATSAAIAVAIIGSANLAFLLGFYGFLRSLFGMNVTYSWSRNHNTLCNLISFAIGLVLALAVAARMRTALRSCGESRSKSSWPLIRFIALLAILGLLWGFVEMRDRVARRRAEISYYAARIGRARDPETATYYARRKQWCEHAMWRPWLPIRPE